MKKFRLTLLGLHELHIREKIVTVARKNDLYLEGHLMSIEHRRGGDVTDDGDIIKAAAFTFVEVK